LTTLRLERLIGCASLFAVALIGRAQAPSGQTVRGVVVEKATRTTIPGVEVSMLHDSTVLQRTSSDVDGKIRLENVVFGRHRLVARAVGYSTVTMENIMVSAGRETVVNIEMEETATELGQVEVIAHNAGAVRNEMAMISARQFSVEETDRYAGSRGDPGRMASNFAGVQGADDSRNDIVVRGNSPQGVLWRFEGVNIPNPNHFSIPGTSGGPVTILNNKYLANSDFFTGAFPAEFGNTIAGVFDLRMRNGNAEKHELTAQLGFLGTEIMAEGPLSKTHRSSYLISYRYSTLQLFEFMHIPIGTDAVPQYQDAAFRLNFPTGKKGSLALWGIGGSSEIGIVVSDQEKPETGTDIYAMNDRDQYFRSRMGTAGLTWTRSLSENTFFKATLSASDQRMSPDHNYVYRHVEEGRYVVDSLPALLCYRFKESRTALYLALNHKFSRRTTIKAGVNTERQALDYLDSTRAIMPRTDENSPHLLGSWRIRWDANTTVFQLQPYVQVKHRFGEQWTATFGLNSFYNSINTKSFSPVEPRFGLSYAIDEHQRLSLGYGLHSQMQPGYLYFYGSRTIDRDPQEQNAGMGLTKSHHLVLGYDRLLGRNLRMKVETYYQYLFDIPVTFTPSSFSLVNTGSGFDRFFPDSLNNTGLGRNYGLEFTLERSFHKGYYFLITASVFNSEYQGSDHVWRNTSFNGRYASNLVVAREINVGKRSIISIGGKLTYAGGRWYGPVDRTASDAEQEVVYADGTVNTEQFPAYFRADLKLSFKWNRTKVLHEFGLDLVNVTGQQNILALTYSPDHPSGDPVRKEYQLGFLPLFFYKIDL
jgi:hypothetical protein